MESRPNTEAEKWYALVILLFIFMAIYFLVFQSFFTEHSFMNEEIQDLEESRKEYTELAHQIPELQKRIQMVKETVGDNTSFLIADTYNLGTSELTRILKEIVSNNSNSVSECQTISQTPSKDKDLDQFEKITLKVRMRCQYPKMVNVILDLENNTPKLFISDLNFEQRVQSQSRRNQIQAQPLMEVRFDLYAYMNKVVKKTNDKK
jgi:general secretion pathway protein M